MILLIFGWVGQSLRRRTTSRRAIYLFISLYSSPFAKLVEIKRKYNIVQDYVEIQIRYEGFVFLPLLRCRGPKGSRAGSCLTKSCRGQKIVPRGLVAGFLIK